MTTLPSVRSLWPACCLLAAVVGPFTAVAHAQIVSKSIGKAERAAADRPAGTWRGTATEALGDGSPLSYPIELEFTGPDDALRLHVRGTARVPAEGQTLTVSISARYEGRFAAGKLALRSTQIEVKIVESGETIPSAPQQLEGTFADGKLTGQVGSQQDGWTKFEATPAGANTTTNAPAPAAVPLAGTYRGTVREPGPDGRELNYPIVFEFTGDAGSLRATAKATVQYPTPNGPTPVEFAGSYQGRVVDGRAELESTQVTARIVAQNRTETLPTQQLRGRFENGRFVGTVDSDGNAPAHVELQREGGAPVPAPVHDRVDDQPAPPVRNGGSRGKSAYDTLVLEPRELPDPSMGGIASHTVLVPKGWQFQGGARWNANPDHIVDFVGELAGPAQESLRFLPNRLFNYSRIQSQLGVQDETRGQRNPDGSTARHAPQKPGEVATEVFLRELRPAASDVELLVAERMPNLEESYRAANKSWLDMIEASLAQMRSQQLPGMQSDSQTWLVVERARVRYRESGVAFEEEFQYAIWGMHSYSQNEMMRTDNGFWLTSMTRSARAKAGELDGRIATLMVCADSVRETPRWAYAVGEIRLAIARAKAEGARANLQAAIQRGEQAARDRAALSDQQMASWRDRQDSLDRMHKATVDTLAERQDFRSAEGKTYTLTNHYDRAFRTSNGGMIITNDVNFRPEADPALRQVQWEELKRVDPFRDGR